jgi:hypothetical protein
MRYRFIYITPFAGYRLTNPLKISDHQQSWGYEDGPWKGLGPPLLVAADLSQFISRRHSPNSSLTFRTGLHCYRAFKVICFKREAALIISYCLKK